MSANQESQTMPEPQPSPAAPKKRHSWLGGTFKNLLTHTATNARLAIDTVRERFENPSKHESSTVLVHNDNHDAQLHKRPVHRHRRTISARTALSPWRSHLPRHSVEHKRHSLADLLDRSEYQENEVNDPECFYDVASHHERPASDMEPPDLRTSNDDQARAPSLRLDLGLSNLNFDDQPFSIETVVVHQPTTMTIGKPVSPSKLLDVFQEKHSPTASELFVPDPLQPVAEARISTPLEKDSDVLQDAVQTITFESPLPGTTLQMDFEKTYPDIAGPLNADLETSPTPKQQKAWTELALSQFKNASSAHRAVSTKANATLVIGTTSQLGESVPATALGEFGETKSDSLESSHGFRHETSMSAPAYSGPPSPDRSVILPIRTKASFSSHKKDLDTSNKRHLRTSEESDLTVALLRERTSDDYAFVFDKLGTHFDAAALPAATLSRAENTPIMSSAMLDSGMSPSRDSVSPLPQTKHNTTPSKDDSVSAYDNSSPTLTTQWLPRRHQGSSSVAESSSPSGRGPIDESTHNRFTLLAVQDDTDDEDGEDLPECFNIGVTYT